MIQTLDKGANDYLTRPFRTGLLGAVWGPGFINQSQYLRVFIAQIRKKIERDPNRPIYLITESGVGNRFVSTLK